MDRARLIDVQYLDGPLRNLSILGFFVLIQMVDARSIFRWTLLSKVKYLRVWQGSMSTEHFKKWFRRLMLGLLKFMARAVLMRKAWLQNE